MHVGQSVSHPKPQESQKSQKWPKITYFSNILDNIYQTETIRSLKLGYSSGQGLLPTICSGEKLLRSVSEEF